MIPSKDQYIATSLKEFLNYRTLTDFRAFQTVTGELFPYPDPKWQGKSALGSRHAGWVYDASISGAVVPTGLSGYNAVPDYRNGRFLVPSGVAPSGLSAVYSFNEVNYYVAGSPESKLIFEDKYPQVSGKTFVPPNSTVAPCVFVKSFFADSRENSFGGEMRSKWIFRIIAMMRTESQLMNIQNLVVGISNEIIPIVTGSVLDPYNNLKTPGWTYPSVQANYQDYALIEDTTFRIQELDLFTDDNPQMFVGIGNIEVIHHSNPRFNSRPG